MERDLNVAGPGHRSAKAGGGDNAVIETARVLLPLLAYPAGMKGEQIPLGAGIVSAVDCLDAWLFRVHSG